MNFISRWFNRKIDKFLWRVGNAFGWLLHAVTTPPDAEYKPPPYVPPEERKKQQDN